MDSLKTRIEGLRQQNTQYRSFIPDHALRQTLTRDVIRNELDSSIIEVHLQKEITSRIIHSGRKIFAVLVLIDQVADVAKFIEAEELQDTRLPFDNGTLEKVGLVTIAVTKFLEKQWELSAPLFARGTLNRRFEDRIVLPFTQQSDEGRGAWGKVYRIRLHPDHQANVGTSSFPEEFVRKEMEQADDHRQELASLSILNHLKHPNIVELLTSFTYQGKHNLLFPLAEHGTLAKLLESNRRDTQFKHDDDFLVALAGLSSAVTHVHDFSQSKIDLKLIGCHHDLRPPNVLVSHDKLVLADFGLCRFKESTQNSDTPFQRGMGDYLAPECEDLETFKPEMIHRSSDIWSFGCMMAEMATYIAHGPEGVVQFREKRVTFVRTWKFSYFHDGPGKPSQVVMDWLAELKQSTSQACSSLATLATAMLAIDESSRPKARDVMHRLQFISLGEMTSKVAMLFERYRADKDGLNALIEHMRLLAWQYATGLKELASGSVWSLDYNELMDYSSSLGYLRQMVEYFEHQQPELEDSDLGLLRLCNLNDRLGELLDAKQQERARNAFKISVMEDDETASIELATDSLQSLSLDRDIRLSAALKHIGTILMNNPHTAIEDRQLHSRDIRIVEAFGVHSIGHLTATEPHSKVLVEWRKYGAYSPDEALSQRLVGRLNDIVERMSAERSDSMKTLNCRGYFHDRHRASIGILYDFPRAAGFGPSPAQPFSLQHWISETTSRTKLWPALDDRFRLAYTIVKTILEFHLLGWLHKDLSSSNVAFFTDKDFSKDDCFREPHIIGFNHSRPDEPDAFTSGIVATELRAYQHPTYRRKARGFKPEYDYYSLGIILMEIGYWRPISEIAGLKKTYGDEHDQKIKSRVSQLKQLMGRAYSDAVAACIDTDFPSLRAESSVGKGSLFMDFESKVLSKLNSCPTMVW